MLELKELSELDARLLQLVEAALDHAVLMDSGLEDDSAALRESFNSITVGILASRRLASDLRKELANVDAAYPTELGDQAAPERPEPRTYGS